MATVIANVTVSVQYREQYVSQGLNAKMSTVPRGIVRGAYLVPHAVDPNKVTMIPDPATGETVINAAGIANLVGSMSDVYSVTYRSDTSIDIPIAVNAVRPLHFIYLVGGYSPLVTTAAQIIDYSEAEFEAGTPDAAGGVLIGVIRANSVSGAIPTASILTAGMSNTSKIPFRTHLQANFNGAQGFCPVRERVADRLEFSYSNAKRNLISIGANSFSDPASILVYVPTGTPVGNGYLKYYPSGIDGSNTITIHGGRFDIPYSDTFPRKVRVEMIYKTAALVSIGANSAIRLRLYKNDGSTVILANPSIAPIIDFPVVATTNWSLYVTEFDIPQDDGSGIEYVGANVMVLLQSSLAEFGIASVSAIVFQPPSVQTEIKVATGASYIPSSYGTLASVADLSGASQPQQQFGGVSIPAALNGGYSDASTGWLIRGQATQNIYNKSDNTLYIAPDTNSVGTSHLHIGADGTRDVTTSFATSIARPTSLTVHGNGIGTSNPYAATFDQQPVLLDEIRPTGSGFASDRIDLRDVNGDNTTFPPPFLSSAGTAGCTAVLEYSSGTGVWSIDGANTDYINLSTSGTGSVALLPAAVTVSFLSDLVLPYIPICTYSSISKEFFVVIGGVVAGQFLISVRDMDGTAVTTGNPPANGDKIYVSCIGRLA